MTSRRNNTLWTLLALAPLGFLLFWIARLAMDMPYLDAWDFALVLQKSYEGQLSFRDLVAQHNESRMLFPRLVMLPLAHLTDWNILAEVGGVVLLAGLVFLAVNRQLRAAFRQSFGRAPAGWIAMVFACLLFSVLQHENWSFGFTLGGLLSLAAAVGGLALLAQPGFSWPRLWTALLAGTVAMYSYSNGMLFWVVGLLPLAAALREERRAGPAPWIAWAAWAALAVALFYVGYRKPGCMPPLQYFLEHPGPFLGYFLALLGGALANAPDLPLWAPVAAGAAGVLLFGAAALVAVFRDPPTARVLSFWLALGGYAALGALAIAVGRSGNGIPHALESRYTTLSTLFWVANLALAVLLLEFAGRAPAGPALRRVRTGLKALLLLGLAAGGFLFARSSSAALESWQAKHDSLQAVRDELLCFAPDPALLARSFPDAAKLKPRMDFLARRGLSLFRDKKPFTDYKVIPVAAGSISSVRSNTPPAAGFRPNIFILEGQACDPGLQRRARGVLLVDTGGVIVARARVGQAAHFRAAPWHALLPAAKFSTGPARLEAYAILREGDLLAPLGAVELLISPPIDPLAPPSIAFAGAAPVLAGCVDQMGVAEGRVHGSGWARNPATGRPGDWVLITDERTNLLAYAGTGEPREDVARHLGNPALLASGWRLSLPAAGLAPGRRRLAAWLFLPETGQALKLQNEFEVEIER